MVVGAGAIKDANTDVSRDAGRARARTRPTGMGCGHDSGRLGRGR